MSEINFQGGGGNIFARVWRPETPRAVVVIAHGVNSHSGYYIGVGEQLSNAGFAVYVLDHRGRGRSDGERYFVHNIDEYVDDLATFIQIAKTREPGLPVFLLGHSAGGVISATYTLTHQAELAGFICESFAFQVYAPAFALAVVKGLSHIAPHAHVLRLPIKEFSRDQAVVDAMLADEMIADEVQPTSTVAALVRADERLKKEFPTITLPLLILHGTADKVTKPSGSELFHATAGSSDKTLKLYEGAAHDLLNDLDKDVVLGDIRGWIDARIPAR